MVVILIIGIVSAATLSVVVPAYKHRGVSSAALLLQATISQARDLAIKANAPRGFRLVPDQILNGNAMPNGSPAPSDSTRGQPPDPDRAGAGLRRGVRELRPAHDVDLPRQAHARPIPPQTQGTTNDLALLDDRQRHPARRSQAPPDPGNLAGRPDEHDPQPADAVVLDDPPGRTPPVHGRRPLPDHRRADADAESREPVHLNSTCRARRSSRSRATGMSRSSSSSTARTTTAMAISTIASTASTTTATA